MEELQEVIDGLSAESRAALDAFASERGSPVGVRVWDLGSAKFVVFAFQDRTILVLREVEPEPPF